MPPERHDEVMRRDFHSCRGHARGVPHVCSGRLEVHHIKARGMGGSSDPTIHDLDNLVVLCTEAHAWVEAHPTEARSLDLKR